ncbi:MAG: DEAD/DEAH box helicase [Acholeplasma sp.]|nr:DEAD/DEAH box helicase [Acholeplasma sp.]
MITFKDLDLHPDIQKAIDKLEFVHPTEIQAASIPVVRAGQDMIGQAQTGTGKTFSFAIPIVEKIDMDNPNIQALILLPTRELSLQVYAEFLKLIRFSRQIRATVVYGGQSIDRQIRSLKEKPQIIIGTPGRIIDHMNRGTLNFDNLKMLVMDEADEMLKMGFQEDLETILKDTPKERQTVLFSATIPPFIKKVASSYQKDPVHIKIEAKTLTVEKIKQVVYEVRKEYKDDLLVRLLDFYHFRSIIIFANTKKGVDDLVSYLQNLGYNADALHGDLKQLQRDRVMNAFRSNQVKILVATDVAARGLDINDVEAIINYDIPQELEVYVHRIGRTGRAGKSGYAITLSNAWNRRRIKELEHFTKSPLELKEVPSVDDIHAVKIKGIYNEIETMITEKRENKYEVVIQKLLADGYDGIDIINALMTMSIDETDKEYRDIPVERAYREDRSRQDRRPSDRRSDRSDRGSERRSSDRSDRPARPQGERSGRQKEFVEYEINFGKEDQIRAVSLIDLFKKEADLYSGNVGDITIGDKKTVFQLNKGASNRILQLEGKKYKNKSIKLRKL